MKRLVQIALVVLMSGLTQNASALSKDQVTSLGQALQIMVENGVKASGTRDLISFRVLDFVGDLNLYTNQIARCSGSVNGESFSVEGDSCKNLVEKFRGAGIGGKEKGFIMLHYLSCMLSFDGPQLNLVGCEMAQPLR